MAIDFSGLFAHIDYGVVELEDCATQLLSEVLIGPARWIGSCIDRTVFFKLQYEFHADMSVLLISQVFYGLINPGTVIGDTGFLLGL